MKHIIIRGNNPIKNLNFSLKTKTLRALLHYIIITGEPPILELKPNANALL